MVKTVSVPCSQVLMEYRNVKGASFQGINHVQIQAIPGLDLSQEESEHQEPTNNPPFPT